MTEASLFRVFLDEEKVKDIDLSMFPDGVPCSDFIALDYEKLIPQNFVFLVDKDNLDLTQNYQFYQKYGEARIVTIKKGEIKVLFIPINAVKRVIDSHGNEAFLEMVKQAWIISNHVRKLSNTVVTLDGETAHTVLMGLQQALFVDIESKKSINPLFLELSIKLIEDLSLGNQTLKEYFIAAFSCEYMEIAKKLLFPE